MHWIKYVQFLILESDSKNIYCNIWQQLTTTASCTWQQQQDCKLAYFLCRRHAVDPRERNLTRIYHCQRKTLTWQTFFLVDDVVCIYLLPFSRCKNWWRRSDFPLLSDNFIFLAPIPVGILYPLRLEKRIDLSCLQLESLSRCRSLKSGSTPHFVDARRSGSTLSASGRQSNRFVDDKTYYW